MREAKISLWNNRYTEVFDFTPDKKTNIPNFEIFTRNPEVEDRFIDLESLEKIVASNKLKLMTVKELHDKNK